MHPFSRLVWRPASLHRATAFAACPCFAAVLAFALALGVRTAEAAPAVPANFYVEDATFGAALEVPVALAFLPDGRWLVAEKAGRVRVMQGGFESPTPLVDLTAEVLDNGDRGLLGLAVDPQFDINRYVYLMYTVDPDSNSVDDDDDAFGRLVRYQVGVDEPIRVIPQSRTVLFGNGFSDGPPSGSSTHAVGDLAFGADGSLLVSIGDGAQAGSPDAGGNDPGLFRGGRCDPSQDIGAFRAQDLGSLDGKILRLDPRTGAGLPSNPFFDGDSMSVRSRVWASGLRNPFRFTVRPGTGSVNPAAADPGALLIGDVGWMTWEEIDLATTGGRNFGWPCYEGAQPNTPYQNAQPATHGCSSFGTPEIPSPHMPPLLVWHHADSTLGNPAGFYGNCAIGGSFYTGARYPDAYRGAYFFADFGRSRVRVATLDAAGSLTSVSDFASNGDYPVGVEAEPGTGDLLLISVVTNKIWRVRYQTPNANRKPVAIASASPGHGLAPLVVQFSSAASSDPDGDPLVVSWRFGDGQATAEAAPLHTYANPGNYLAQLTVSDGKGGVARDTALIAVATSLAFPSTPVLDSFAQPDGPLSSAWAVDAGSYVVTSGRAASTIATPDWVMWSLASFGVHQEAFVRLATIGGGTHALVLAAQAAAVNAPRVEVRWTPNAAGGAASIVTSDGQAETTWGDPVPLALGAGDVLGARLFGNGDLELYANGARLATRSIAGWPWLHRGGRIGFDLTNATSARLVDFGGGDLALDSNTAPAASIQSPIDEAFVAEGDTVRLAGSGNDAQDAAGSLAYRWEIDLLHNNHVHPYIYAFDTPTGAFRVENHEDGTGISYLGRFIVTDRGGLRDTATVHLYTDVNLTPGAVLSPPDTALTGTPITLRFRIHNTGGMPSAYSHWVLRSGETAIAQGDTAVLARDSVMVTAPWTAPTMVGSYELTVVVDATNALHETREDDNTATRTITVLAPVLPARFPATPIVDAFNRANGALGSPWSGDVASVTISSNQYKPVNTLMSATVWNGAVYAPDQEAYVKIATLTSASPRHGVLLKVQGATVTTGAIEVRYDGSSKQKKVYVSTYLPGTGWQSRGNFTATFASNDVLGARAKANGDIVVYRNGAVIGTVNVAAWTYSSGGGRIGLTLEKASTTLLDDFGGGSIVAAAPPANHAPIAAANATPGSGVAPLATAFSSAGSSDPDGDPLTYAWNFGDAQTATSANPSHTYSAAGTYIAVLTVSDGRGGSATARDTIVVSPAPPPPPPPPATFPVTPVVDDFNRPDGAIGGAWTGDLAGLSVSTNELKCASTSYLGTVWNGAVFGPTQEAYVKITALTTSATRQGVLLKVQGTTVTTGAIEVRYDASAKQKKVIVATYTPGTGWVNRGSAISVTLSRGDVLGARALANGGVEVYRNGAKIGTVSVSAWAFATSGGRIGLTSEKASSTRYDNFGGGTVQTTEAAPAALGAADGDGQRPALPTQLALSAAWPNPARDMAEFALELPQPSKVRTIVVDVQGRNVWSEHLALGAGHWTLRWRPATGRTRLRAGVYFARIDVGGTRFVRRVVLAP